MANSVFSPIENKFVFKNSQENWRYFFKNNSNFFILVNSIFFICALLISIAVFPKIQILLHEYCFRFFHDFDFFKKISVLFSYSGFWNIFSIFEKNNFLTDVVIKLDYAPYVYGIILVFSLEIIFLIIQFVFDRRRWKKYLLSFGWYENHEHKTTTFLLYRKLTSTMVSCFAMTLLLGIMLYLITFAWVEGILFKHNFFFDLILFFWLGGLFIVSLMSVNYYYWQKHADKKFKRSAQCEQQIQNYVAWYFLYQLAITAFLVFTIFIKLPWDFYLLFCFLKYVLPFQMDSNRKVKHKLIY